MARNNTVIVDYGLGNLRSVSAATAEIGGKPEVTSDLDTIRRAERIILPGVGAFPLAAQYLETSGIGSAITTAAGRGVPILGICLGMQLLFDRGNEFGWSNGLGLIRGDVLPVLRTDEGEGLRGTHIGWRSLGFPPSEGRAPLFTGLKADDSYYFVHSFSANPSDDRNVLATVSYGTKDLVVSAGEANVMGVQFHPEKSGSAGLRLLRNFIDV